MAYCQANRQNAERRPLFKQVRSASSFQGLDITAGGKTHALARIEAMRVMTGTAAGKLDLHTAGLCAQRAGTIEQHGSDTASAAALLHRKLHDLCDARAVMQLILHAHIRKPDHFPIFLPDQREDPLIRTLRQIQLIEACAGKCCILQRADQQNKAAR